MEILYLLGIFVIAKLVAGFIGMLIRRHSGRRQPVRWPDPCLSPRLEIPPSPPDGSFDPAHERGAEVAWKLTPTKGGGDG